MTRQLIKSGVLGVQQLVPYGPPPTIERYLPKSEGVKKRTDERKAFDRIVASTELADWLHRRVRGCYIQP